MPGCTFSVTRSYCSISDTAARSTSTSATGWFHRRDTSWPASTSRFSELRRIRVARWSIWNRLDSRSGSCSPCSRSSISRICRSTSDWLRRDRFTNIALTFPRSAASLAASRSASRWTWSKARATSPISSEESTSMGSTSSETPSPSVSLIRRTVSGSRTPATSRAPVRSRRSGRTMDRPTPR